MTPKYLINPCKYSTYQMLIAPFYMEIWRKEFA